jgi:hypothetical protein
MDCDTIISWEAIVRSAARVNGDDPSCFALAVRTGDAADGQDCDGRLLLTLFAGAWDDDAILVNSDSTGYEAQDCDTILPLSTLAQGSLFVDESGINAIAIEEPGDIDASCGASCDDEGIATSAMIQGSFVMADGQSRALAQAVTGYTAIDCDTPEIGLETIIRGALVKVSAGLWAWRIQYEEA